MIGTKLTNEEALIRIQNKCKEKNVTFLGFDNGENQYKNNKTHLILKCNKCGFVSKQKTYASFVSNVIFRCPNCNGRIKYTEKDLSEKLKIECEERNLIFLGFVEKFKGGFTHFKYKCKKCGYVGESLTYHNFHDKHRGCISCAKNKPYTEIELINKAKKICKDKNLEFIGISGVFCGNKTRINVKCLKCNCMWKNILFLNFQKEDRLCPHCNKSYLEKCIENKLTNSNIEFKDEKTFSWLKNDDGNKLKLDFYLPQYNIAIECQGEQHFGEVEIYGGKEGFRKQNENDILKHDLCIKNGLKIMYFAKENSPQMFLGEKVYNNENNLLKEITSYG